MISLPERHFTDYLRCILAVVPSAQQSDGISSVGTVGSVISSGTRVSGSTAIEASTAAQSTAAMASSSLSITTSSLPASGSATLPQSMTSMSSSTAAISTAFKSAHTSQSVSLAHPTNTQAPGKLSSAAKIGIGLGVPLGTLILLAISFLIFRLRQHKHNSRLRHHGNMAAQGLYPASDESATPEKENNIGSRNSGKAGLTAIEEMKSDDGGPNDREEAHEVHGEHVPALLKELQGDAGPKRHELPVRRGSV